MSRRLPILFALAAAAASGCIYERETVRADPRVEAPPPPADTATTYDSSYQAEAPPPPPGSEVSSEAVFYERLAPYGYWTFVAPYGRVWVPAVAYGWRPYYYGQWVLTDWGWTFVSDDPWGWATYHYGRWNWAVGVGWYWIPGRVWGPAWVSWRYGAGFVTWCPLGPPGVVFAYRHPAWVAVPEQHFTRPIAGVAVPAGRTFPVVTRTTPLSGPHATVGRGSSFGPPVSAVARATGQQIRPVAAAQVVRARPTVASPARTPSTGMRSPVQPRARVGSAPQGVRPVPTSRPGEGPRAAPSGSRPPSAPRPQAAPSQGGAGPAPRASPPPSGGQGPRAVVPRSGDRGRPQAHAQ